MLTSHNLSFGNTRWILSEEVLVTNISFGLCLKGGMFDFRGLPGALLLVVFLALSVVSLFGGIRELLESSDVNDETMVPRIDTLL